MFNLHTGLSAQLSRCVHTITFRKPYIASLEIWTIGLRMDALLDHLTIIMLDIRLRRWQLYHNPYGFLGTEAFESI